MRKKGIFLMALIAAIVLFLSSSFAQQTMQQSPAPAQMQQQRTIQSGQKINKINSFSADLMVLNPQKRIQREAKIYITSSKIRMDNFFQKGGPAYTMIYRRDSNVRLMFNPANKTYAVKPLNEAEFIAFTRAHTKARNEKTVGTEMVSGFQCSIKTIETMASFKGSTRKIISTIWISPSLDIPIRIQSPDGSITELRNIKATSFQPALFDVPAGYKRVSIVEKSWGRP